MLLDLVKHRDNMSFMKSDPVWERLQEEAVVTAREEPALASLLEDVILSRDCLEEALASRLSRKLAYHATPEGYLRDVFLEAFRADSLIGECIRRDIVCTFERDPACEDYLTPFLYYKGFQAISAYRVAHFLWQHNRKSLAYYFESLISEVFAVDIHPAAQIGGGIFLDHATGFVAGETAVIGDNVSILHEVTLGGTGKQTGDRHPKIRSGVLIGAGAKILGNVTVGECAKIGANSVILSDVPAHTTVVGVPGREIGQAREDSPALWMDHNVDCGGSATS